jgi:TorA maturation chaperone TorD
MNLQTQDATSTSVPSWTAEPVTDEQLYRAGAYRLLATLLRDVPGRNVLDQVTELAAVEGQHDELAMAMSMLGLAARDSLPQHLDGEFNALFIGLGRGELVPYGSWYLTGFLNEKPLALLRDDLLALGYERTSSTNEPEDHIAALCEVMAMLISDEQAKGNKALQTQTDFFEAHIANWADRFFNDLSQAKHAVFYRAVGRFGRAFIELEHHYLAMKV